MRIVIDNVEDITDEKRQRLLGQNIAMMLSHMGMDVNGVRVEFVTEGD